MNRADSRRMLDLLDQKGGVPHYFTRHATLNGDGSGGLDLVSDYSGQTVAYFLQPGAGTAMRVFRLLGHVRDEGVPAAEKYGSLAELANGIAVHISYDSGASIVDLTEGHTIRSFSDWAAYCYDAVSTAYGSGDNFLNFRWTFQRGGVPIRLTPSDSLRIIVNDNFTGLVDHHFIFQGYKE